MPAEHRLLTSAWMSLYPRADTVTFLLVALTGENVGLVTKFGKTFQQSLISSPETTAWLRSTETRDSFHKSYMKSLDRKLHCINGHSFFLK